MYVRETCDETFVFFQSVAVVEFALSIVNWRITVISVSLDRYNIGC